MFNIQVLNDISKKGLETFSTKQYTISKSLSNPDALLVRSFNLHDYVFPASLQVVGRAGAGVNTIPIQKLTELGIPVLNTPGANTNAVRELVLAGLLMASRHICKAWQYVNQLNILDDATLSECIEKNKKQFSGSELRGQKLGVIGLGNIGVKVANTAAALGMKIFGYDPNLTIQHAWELSSEVKPASDLKHLFQEADFITIHVPLLESTKKMIDASLLKHLKPHATLLNFSRAEVVDENALLEALNQNQLKTYVSDFPTVALMHHPNVIYLPHLGASTHQAEENCAMMIAHQVKEFLEKGTVIHAVNFPNLSMPFKTAHRIALIHRNIPGMVAQISSKLASEKINILSLQNGSHKEIAYTLTDMNTDLPLSILEALKKIEGMIKIRQIENQAI